MPTKRNNNNNRRRQNAGRNSRKNQHGGKLYNASNKVANPTSFAELDNLYRTKNGITAYHIVAIDHETCPILMWIPAHGTATGTFFKGLSYAASNSPLDQFKTNMASIYNTDDNIINISNYKNSFGNLKDNMTQLVVTDVVVLTPNSIIIGKTHYDNKGQQPLTATQFKYKVLTFYQTLKD